MLVTTLTRPFTSPCSLPSGAQTHVKFSRKSAASPDPQTDSYLDWLRESGLPAQKVPKLLCPFHYKCLSLWQGSLMLNYDMLQCGIVKDRLNCPGFTRSVFTHEMLWGEPRN